MSVLDRNVQPRVPTAGQRAQRLRNHIASAWQQIKTIQAGGMNLFWNLPEDITPQDIINELGDDAAEVLTLSDKLAAFIEDIDASSVVARPEGSTITIDETTGAITITT